MNNFFSNSKIQTALFIVLFLMACLFFEYPTFIEFQPQSMHNWRQADCASFARIYYENGMDFFEPRVYNVLAGEGNAVGEFPILYYFVACLYKLFGPHEFLFRGVNLLIFMFGLLSLFQLAKRLLKDVFFAYVIPFVLFSAPLIMFFSNNFLCDITSLSFTLMGWNYLLKYREEQKSYQIWIFLLFFTIAALLKLNSVISTVAIAALYFIELNQWELGNRPKFFNHKNQLLVGFLLCFTTIFAWYKWAIYYNDKHTVTFLGTKVWPNWASWDTTDETFLSTINGFFKNAPINYFLPTIVLLIVLVFFVNRNKVLSDGFLYQSMLLVIIGTLMFIFTFFYGIRDNIYYTINLYIFPVLILLNASYIFKKKYPIAFSSKVFRVIIFAFLAANVMYAKSYNTIFYNRGPEHHRLNENYYHPDFRAFIDKAGIKKEDKVISIGDKTPNASLYSIGRFGWSDYNNIQDEYAFNNAIERGAKYLIVADPNLISTPLIEKYTGNYLANFDNVFVYKLTNDCKSFRNKMVKLKTANNNYVSYPQDNAPELIVCNAIDAKTFYMVDFGNGDIGFKTNGGKYVASNRDTDKKLYINSEWFGAWESFAKFEIDSNKYALKTKGGKFLNLNLNNMAIFEADTFNENSLIIE